MTSTEILSLFESAGNRARARRESRVAMRGFAALLLITALMAAALLLTGCAGETTVEIGEAAVSEPVVETVTPRPAPDTSDLYQEMEVLGDNLVMRLDVSDEDGCGSSSYNYVLIPPNGRVVVQVLVGGLGGLDIRVEQDDDVTMEHSSSLLRRGESSLVGGYPSIRFSPPGDGVMMGRGGSPDEEFVGMLIYNKVSVPKVLRISGNLAAGC